MENTTKKSNLIALSAAVFVALVSIAGWAYLTYAATTENSSNGTPFFGRHMINGNLTDEQKAELTAKQEQFENQHASVRAALDANDYNAWVSAVKAIDADAPILTKITASNFNKLVEAHNDMTKARAIMAELGIERGGMFGAGIGCGGG